MICRQGLELITDPAKAGVEDRRPEGRHPVKLGGVPAAGNFVVTVIDHEVAPDLPDAVNRCIPQDHFAEIRDVADLFVREVFDSVLHLYTPSRFPGFICPTLGVNDLSSGSRTLRHF